MESMTKQQLASPCINVCTLNPLTNLCDGCFRTIDEIAAWGQYSPQQKRQLFTKLEERCERIMDGTF